ncbi:MAG: SPOR domain-containing protein, partial [Bacteroidota bacterium]|nr:SPOR domain-containing protein [Bacteroidota bacterium]
GSFPTMKDALKQKKVFEELSFDVQISKAAENKFRVIVGQANTLGEAQEILSDLKEKGYQGWINQCNCCKMSEEEHLLNRRTDFKIIRL